MNNRDIQKAVYAVFAQHGKDLSIPMGAVAALACQNLRLSNEKEFLAVAKEIKEYIRRSAKRGGRYEIRKGFNGGVSLKKRPNELLP